MNATVSHSNSRYRSVYGNVHVLKKLLKTLGPYTGPCIIASLFVTFSLSAPFKAPCSQF